jgi:hypothetical protein
MLAFLALLLALLSVAFLICLMMRGQVQGECRGIGTHWPWGSGGSGWVGTQDPGKGKNVVVKVCLGLFEIAIGEGCVTSTAIALGVGAGYMRAILRRKDRVFQVIIYELHVGRLLQSIAIAGMISECQVLSTVVLIVPNFVTEMTSNKAETLILISVPGLLGVLELSVGRCEILEKDCCGSGVILEPLIECWFALTPTFSFPCDVRRFALIFGFPLSFTFALAFESWLALTLSFELSAGTCRCVCGGI